MPFQLPEPDETAAFKEHLLERMKVAGRFEITPQLMHDLDVRVYQDAISRMGEKTVVDIQTYVMREKVDVQTTTVPFETTAPGRTVWIGDRRQQALGVLPYVVGAIVSAVCALTTAPVFWIAVAVFVASGALIWREGAPRSIRVDGSTVRGEVEIDANLWHTFPENTTVYPKELGRAVKWVELGEPRFTFDD